MNHGMRILELEGPMILSYTYSFVIEEVEIREVNCLDGYKRDGQEIFAIVRILN